MTKFACVSLRSYGSRPKIRLWPLVAFCDLLWLLVNAAASWRRYKRKIYLCGSLRLNATCSDPLRIIETTVHIFCNSLQLHLCYLEDRIFFKDPPLVGKICKGPTKFGGKSLRKKFCCLHIIQFNYSLDLLGTNQIMIIVLSKNFVFAVVISDFPKFHLS